MKHLIFMFCFPLLLIANLLGGLSAIFIIGALNGYKTTVELMEKEIINGN
jgi:hypothetical protein